MEDNDDIQIILDYLSRIKLNNNNFIAYKLLTIAHISAKKKPYISNEDEYYRLCALEEFAIEMSYYFANLKSKL